MSEKEKNNWFKRHKVLTVLLVLVVIGAIASVGGENTSNTNQVSNEASKSSDNKQPKLAKIGESARDGRFEFVVKKLECGKTTAGTNEYLTEQAQGEFCFLTVSVKNIGTEQQLFSESDQKLLDDTGTQYSPNSVATAYANNNKIVFEQINPGNSVSGILVFDVPKNTKVVKAELHDSAFSNGIAVKLK